jgi:hypothetical protein
MTAVAVAADAEPVRVRDPLGDQPVDPADDVGPLCTVGRAHDRRREITAMTRPPRELGRNTANPEVASHCTGMCA